MYNYEVNNPGLDPETSNELKGTKIKTQFSKYRLKGRNIISEYITAIILGEIDVLQICKLCSDQELYNVQFIWHESIYWKIPPSLLGGGGYVSQCHFVGKYSTWKREQKKGKCKDEEERRNKKEEKGKKKRQWEIKVYNKCTIGKN
jgi:hypothetical protein